MANASISAIIAAGGNAMRFGGIGQLKEKLGGKSVLSHAIDILDKDDDCNEIIITASADVRSWIESDPLTFASGKLKLMDACRTRRESIAAAVRIAQSDLIALHDGNRPNCGVALLDKLKTAVLPERGAVPAVTITDASAYITAIGETTSSNGDTPPADSIFGGKSSDHRLGHVMEHVDGASLHMLQSPQLYYRGSYLKALDAVDDVDDLDSDAEVYIAGGFEVTAIAGARGNIKVVTEADLRLLTKLMGGARGKKKDRYGGLGW